MLRLTLPSVMYLQLILRNFSVRASSSSEVDETTRDCRRDEYTGGGWASERGGPSESCGLNREQWWRDGVGGDGMVWGYRVEGMGWGWGYRVES